MNLKQDADFDAAVKSSSLKKERKDVIVAQLRACRPDKLEELFEVWSGDPDEGGLPKNELTFANSLVDKNAPTPPPPATPSTTAPTTT
jgi:hypothetical protein